MIQKWWIYFIYFDKYLFSMRNIGCIQYELSDQSPLNDLIVEMFPWILLAKMLINFLSGHSQCPFHISGVAVCIWNFTTYVNDIVLVPRITVSIIVPTLRYLLPYLRLCSCLVCGPNVLQSLEAPHVGKIVFQFRSLRVSVQKHICHDFQHVFYQKWSGIFHLWMSLFRPLFPHLKLVMHKYKC